MSNHQFFSESGSDQLQKVYEWARARHVSPWAVLFGVLLRVSATVPPYVQLPGVIGDRASLNLLCAFVGRPGTGKGATAKVAALAWPTDVLVLPLGSGQGIAQVFANQQPGEVKPVIFDVPEVDTLTGFTKTQGSVLLPAIKCMAMGEQLGQTNATKETTRNVPAHSYRACMSLGVQPGHSSVLFGDATGGTPQRFLWVQVADPYIEDEDFDDPAPLDTSMPVWVPGDDGVVEIVYAEPEIPAVIKSAHVARNRGEVDALDGHAILTRCKVAALLAIMHGRTEVTAWDWDRAGDIMVLSDQTRATLLAQEAEIQAAALRERGKHDALRSEGREDYRRDQLESVKASIVNTLVKRDGQASYSDVKTALGKPHRRKLLDDALAELVAEGQIVPLVVTGGKRYRLTEGVQGEQAVQGESAQFSGDERVVQGERSATVTSLDDHRSGKRTGHRVSCRKWLEGYLSDLRAKGFGKVRGADVREAGQAAGYSLNSLYVAANTLGYKGEVWELAG